jgi:hypothetical protein
MSLPVPYLLDAPPNATRTPGLTRALASAARAIESLALLPLADVVRLGIEGPHVAPLVTAEDWPLLSRIAAPRLIELPGWDQAQYEELTARFPGSVVTVRLPMDADLVPLLEQGARVFHLTANYHGRVGGRFASDLIRSSHERLVGAGRREEVTLIGSGGIVAAEHVPKALIFGLDAVAIDTAAWVALQASFRGPCVDGAARFELPRFREAWAVQRLQNLIAAWRDQLLEVLGAMGLREVRRLRGELGRCMFQKDLEDEAFEGIEGYAN